MDCWTISRGCIVGGGLLWLAVALVTASDPVPVGPGSGVPLVTSGFVVGVAWVIYSLSWLGVFASWRRALVWLTVPLCPVVAGHATCTEWPLAVRVWLSESAVLREQATPRPIDPFEYLDSARMPPKRVGLLWVRSVWNGPDGTVMFFAGRVCVADHGVLYAPDGPPRPIGEGRVFLRHLYGPWYRYTMSD